MLIEKSVDRESQQKLYVQIYSIIKDKIVRKEWHVGSQIPTEDELCKAYNVSKATVRMAIAELVRNGYLKKQQGKGTFVTRSLPDLGITMKTKLAEDMFGEGVRASKEILVRGWKKPPDDVQEHLRSDAEVYYILCKRVVNGEPAYLEETFVPPDIVPDIDDLDVCQMPLYDMVQEKATKRIFRVVQTIEISEVNSEAAEILKTVDGTAALLLHRLLVAADGQPIAYTRLVGDSKKYKLQTELIQMT